MPGVFRRGKTFHFRYRFGGRQYRVTLVTEDELEAHQRAKAILANPERAEGKVWATELNAYLKERVEAGRMSANAAGARRNVLMCFAAECNIIAPRFVTTDLAQRWYEAKRTEVEEVTAQTYLRWLKTFIAYLADRGRVVQRVGPLELRRVKSHKRKPFCTAKQVEQIIESAPDDDMRFILFAGFHAGLRRGEIAEARPEWFDLDAGLLQIERSETWEPKDRDARTIPLTKEFARFLKTYLPGRGPFVLKAKPMKRARRWRYRYDFRRPFEAMVAAASMEWVTPHTMRRTFASLKVSAGVSLYKVAVWLGDLEKVVQDHYGYLIPKDSDIDRGL